VADETLRARKKSRIVRDSARLGIALEGSPVILLASICRGGSPKGRLSVGSAKRADGVSHLVHPDRPPLRWSLQTQSRWRPLCLPCRKSSGTAKHCEPIIIARKPRIVKEIDLAVMEQKHEIGKNKPEFRSDPFWGSAVGSVSVRPVSARVNQREFRIHHGSVHRLQALQNSAFRERSL